MATRRFRPSRHRRASTGTGKKAATDTLDTVIRQARTSALARRQGYRERSLQLHGWICAKCAREFDASNLHLLTVHHKDGNHDHNPPDGSNWENLCAYCHDDEHSRNLLADYLSGDRDKP
jgi:hypothetical protein